MDLLLLHRSHCGWRAIYAFFSFAYLLYSPWRFLDAPRNQPDLFNGDFERSGVFLVILFMMYNWNKYQNNKPVKSGVYLISNESIDPPLRACSYYDLVHGWTGIGHILEKSIDCWAEFPVASGFQDRVKIQSCSYNN